MGSQDIVAPREKDEQVSISLMSEISTMELIRTKTTIPIPRIFGYDVTLNEFGYPYLLMEVVSRKYFG